MPGVKYLGLVIGQAVEKLRPGSGLRRGEWMAGWPDGEAGRAIAS